MSEPIEHVHESPKTLRLHHCKRPKGRPDMKDPIELSTEERMSRVINHAFGGRHHVKIKEETSRFIRLVTCRDMATYDTDCLTALVVAAHTYGVRVEIAACNMQYVSVYLHARDSRDGDDQWSRHPTALDLADRATKHWELITAEAP